MTEYLKYNDPLHIVFRKGTEDDPYVPIEGTQKIINNIIVLDEIPDEFSHVQIENYTEIFEGEPTSTQFKVNYQNGIVTFNPSEEGKTVSFSAVGRGIILYPAERIYIHSEEPNILKTFQNVVDEAEEAIEAVNNLDDAIDEANTLKTELNELVTNGTTLNTNLLNNISDGNELNDTLEILTIPDANNIKGELEGVIDSAGTAKTNLDGSITTGNTLKGDLNGLISDGGTLKTDLSTLVTNGTTLKSDLSGQISEGNTLIPDLNTAVITANTAKGQLDGTIESANTAKNNLDGSIATGNTLKSNLDDSIDAGDTLKTQLDTLVTNGTTLHTNLSGKISEGTSLIPDLYDAVSTADTAKGQLDGTIESANTSIDELNAYAFIEEYNANTDYVPLNKVVYQGSTYQNKVACKNILPTNTTYWILVSAKGADGSGTTVTPSEINGNIILNGYETTVYTHPGSGTNPHGTTKEDIGLGNVENKSSATIIGEITKEDIVSLGIPAQDTVYTHPSTHPASMITESTTRRFITDTERTNWNDANSKKHEHTNKTVIDKFTEVDGKPYYNGEEIGGTVPNLTGTSLTLGNYTLSYNAISNSLDIEVVE